MGSLVEGVTERGTLKVLQVFKNEQRLLQAGETAVNFPGCEC